MDIISAEYAGHSIFVTHIHFVNMSSCIACWMNFALFPLMIKLCFQLTIPLATRKIREYKTRSSQIHVPELLKIKDYYIIDSV